MSRWKPREGRPETWTRLSAVITWLVLTGKPFSCDITMSRLHRTPLKQFDRNCAAHVHNLPLLSPYTLIIGQYYEMEVCAPTYADVSGPDLRWP